MQFIFDHIYAIIIASVIMLILMANQMRALETSIEDTSMYQSKTDVLDFANMIEEDLSETLHRYIQGAPPFTWPITHSGGKTTIFEFYRDSPTETRMTRYMLAFVDSLQQNDNTMIPLYRIDREVCIDDGSGCTYEWGGESAPWITDFDVEPLELDKSPATSLATAHFLKISFIMSPPFRTSQQVVDKLQWSSMLQVRKY